jgi:hypothetical protein
MGATKSQLRAVHQDALEINVLHACHLTTRPAAPAANQHWCECATFRLFAWKAMMKTGSSAEFRYEVKHSVTTPKVLEDAGRLAWWFDHPEASEYDGKYVLTNKQTSELVWEEKLAEKPTHEDMYD